MRLLFKSHQQIVWNNFVRPAYAFLAGMHPKQRQAVHLFNKPYGKRIPVQFALAGSYCRYDNQYKHINSYNP